MPCTQNGAVQLGSITAHADALMAHVSIYSQTIAASDFSGSNLHHGSVERRLS